jgi:hypothetical protein
MKVINIEQYKARDKTDRWKISFEGDPNPLIMGTPPTFKVGTDFPKEQLKLTEKNRAYFYVLTKEDEADNETPTKQRSIELQAIFRGIVDLFIAGKLDDFVNSENHLAMGAMRYAERRLVHDHPLVEEALKR